MPDSLLLGNFMKRDACERRKSTDGRFNGLHLLEKRIDRFAYFDRGGSGNAAATALRTNVGRDIFYIGIKAFSFEVNCCVLQLHEGLALRTGLAFFHVFDLVKATCFDFGSYFVYLHKRENIETRSKSQ